MKRKREGYKVNWKTCDWFQDLCFVLLFFSSCVVLVRIDSMGILSTRFFSRFY